MMRLVKVVVPWIISAALCVLAIEALGAAVVFYKGHRLIYFNTDSVPPPVVETTRYKQRLHPYFGYTGPYHLQTNTVLTNNLGFAQRQDRLVPFKPEPNDFVVFVFGSSVAGNVVAPPQGGDPLQAVLQELPQLKGRNVVVYNMAQGPQKQPQQLMELAFLVAMGQHIDMVLSIAGTVEFTSGLSNFESDIDPIFPPAATLGALGRELAPPDSSSADYHELAFHLARDRAAVKLYSKAVIESRSGLSFLTNRFLLAFHSKRLIEDLSKYESTITRKGGWDDTKKLLSLDMTVSVTKDNVIDAVFQTWMRCSDAMRVMATANGALFLEIVHPNPYYTKKKLTPAETAILAAVPETEYLRRGSVEGYKLIERQTDALKSRGIVSATPLFDDIAEQIYIDSSGHFSSRGETMLGKFVADQVAAKLDSVGERAQANTR
jgi:hypothetical protein